MDSSPNHAIVFGASGLIGWAVVDQLLRAYPEAKTFSRVTAVTNRKVEESESHWHTQGADRPSLQLVSGIDLARCDGAALAEALTAAVEDVHTVTHLYYLVFASVPDEVEEVATNRAMLQNVIDAHNLLCPNLQFVVFPGGTRGYGIYLPGGVFTPPLTEDMVENLPPDYAKTCVYPANRELLNKASEGRKWTWCEVCPDAIIGFTPNGSQFSLSLHWAQYLSLYAYNHGIGPSTKDVASGAIEVPFPGTTAGANALFSPASAGKIAQFMIYASLHPSTCGSGQLFNIADREAPCTYGELWPQLAKWFGLVGVGPSQGRSASASLGVGQTPEDSDDMLPGAYVAKHAGVFEGLGYGKAIKGGVGAGNRQLDSVGHWLSFDRQLSLEKLKNTGFHADVDPVQSWIDSFRMFREAGLIL
ncbi:hypothetical protein F4808DRAFT_443121 [Astrocystis sublimbata]|nr:hypothetical protein F4808DRAFT_443121 [Astrocystis sublimbata]